MNTLQVWMLIGIPTLMLAAAMFVRRSPWRSYIGYAALLAGFAGMAVYSRTSAAVFGGLTALLYAAGRGGTLERQSLRQDEEGVEDAALHPARRFGGTNEPAPGGGPR
ncbi:hypothetical protein BH24ACT15_BH24ACT15_18520 [soil metagenome]